MRVKVASPELALLPLCISAVLGFAHIPLAGSASHDQDLSEITLNRTSSIASLNTSKVSQSGNAAFEESKNISQSQPFKLNRTSTRVEDPSTEAKGRHMIEVTESTQHGYLTSNCDAHTLGIDGAVAFDSMLAEIQSNLRIVINQAKKGPASPYGFSALFKSRANSGKVADLFTEIMNADVADNDPLQGPIKPLTVCIGPQANVAGAERMDVLYAACQLTPDWRAVQPPRSNLVLLCPSFWQMPDVPPAGSCPKRDKNGVMAPNKEWLQLNQQAVFVHEMVHMYIGNGYLIKNETYRVADAVALSEEESMKNPSNYAFFYAAVMAGCRKWSYLPRKTGSDDGGL